MPSVSPEMLERLELLCRTHRIEFIGDLPRSEWPSNHKIIFADVANLGTQKFDQYATDPNDNPWKVEAKYQAKLLVESVERCRERNEATWRRHFEPRIFARMETEVACKNCRKRVWRSEIEAARTDTASTRSRSLLKRQAAREPCRCPRDSRSQDFLEAVGLNRIFSHRQDERVCLDKALAKVLKKDVQKPDAIYGLRQTRVFENLLHDCRTPEFQLRHNDSAAMQLHEILDPSPLAQPLNQRGDMLLFPFLVLEAKSDSSTSSWHSIDMQTAFPIKAFLDAQNRLKIAVGEKSKWSSGPLVWFFSNRGEDWRVSVAYVESRQAGKRKRDGTKSHVYRVADVWHGSICQYDGAIQLLLLVGYVFDWARDVYRENIIQELRILASGDNDTACSLYSDTAILSLRQREPFAIHDEREEYLAYTSLQKSFTAFDKTMFPVRHAMLVESRYCCVVVTADNVQTLLQSTDHDKMSTLWQQTLDHFTDCNLLDLSTICAMEKQWTGNSRLIPPGPTSVDKFYTVVSCTDYLSLEWHHIRELYLVAISPRAWSSIANASGLAPHTGTWGPLQYGLINQDSMINELRTLQGGSVRQTLFAAIRRRSVKIQCKFPDPENSHGHGQQILPAMCVQSDPGFHFIVQSIYEYFKKGILEPDEPFIEFSKRFVQQHALEDDTRLSQQTLHASSQAPDEGCIVVTGQPHSQFHPGINHSNYCIYIVDENPALPPKDQLLDKVKRALETRDIYSSYRGTVISQISQTAQRGNLEDEFGMRNGKDAYIKTVSTYVTKVLRRELHGHQDDPE